MNKNEYNAPRTLQDLVLRFKNIQIQLKNVESNSKSLTKINSELDNIVKSIVINLLDVLDNQSEISLWFFNGVPTTENEPYSNWQNPSDHEGDLYYDKSSGKVYQFDNLKLWEERIISDLVQAMAITNTQTDTTEDHERKIYFNQPAPEYKNGDWWIKEDGTLLICQISKSLEQEYEISDWIDANKYTSSVATKIDDVIKVLKGTITTISDTYATFTDLATGGSTIINGSNIKTGTIDANLVTIANNLVQLGSFGIKLGNGAEIIGADGLKGTYLFKSEGMVGYEWDFGNNSGNKKSIFIDAIIPTGFKITKAIVKLIHSPAYWSFWNESTLKMEYSWGNAKNLKLYKCTNLKTRLICADYGGDVWSTDDNSEYSEIANAYGTEGFTSETPSTNTHNLEKIDSIDISEYLEEGLNRLKIETSNSIPGTITKCALSTGAVQILLQIEGFIPYNPTNENNNGSEETDDEKAIRLAKEFWINEYGTIEGYSFSIAHTEQHIYVVCVTDSNTQADYLTVDIQTEDVGRG